MENEEDIYNLPGMERSRLLNFLGLWIYDCVVFHQRVHILVQYGAEASHMQQTVVDDEQVQIFAWDPIMLDDLECFER